MNAKMTASLAIAVVAVMVFATVGSTTYSWFSDSEETDINVTTATVKMDAYYMYTTTVVGDSEPSDWAPMTIVDNGYASKSSVSIKNITDNDSINVSIGNFSNEATIPVDYYFNVKITAGDDIDAGALTINGVNVPALVKDDSVEYLVYSQFSLPAGDVPDEFDFTISTVNNVFKQGDEFKLTLTSVAYQANSPVTNAEMPTFATVKNIVDGFATVDIIDPNTMSNMTVSISVPESVDADEFIVEPKTSDTEGTITLGFSMKKGDVYVTSFDDPVELTVTVPYEVYSITHIKDGSIVETIMEPELELDSSAPQYTYTFETSSFSDFIFNKPVVKIYDKMYGTLQAAIDEAVDGDVITILADLEEDVIVTQSLDTKFTIDGNGNYFAGVITVDGKSATITSAGLTIKNVNFKADSISEDACIRFGDDTDDTRYICNVTVEKCTFDVPGAVGVKSYTGGDHNLTIIGCTATNKAHSLVQVVNVEENGVVVKNCHVYSKNGLNFNSTAKVIIEGCDFDVSGYAVRFGVAGGNSDAEAYLIKDCTMKSDCEESSDAVIILRGSANNATLTIQNTTLEGNPEIKNDAGATVIINDILTVYTVEELQNALSGANAVVAFGQDLIGDVIIPKNDVIIIGNGHYLYGSISINGKSDVTLKGIVFDAAYAKMSYDGSGKAKQYANIMGAESKGLIGARNLAIEDCTFTGTFTNGGAAISFVDQSRKTGNSGDITITGCEFDTEGAYYDIYCHYSGYGDFVIKDNTFKTEFPQGMPVYLGRYASSIPVVVSGNVFETTGSLEDSVYVQDHSNYGVSINASNNTFAS